MSGIRQLRDDLKRGGITHDPFTVGDVIRWTTENGYTYAAIKTPVGWATTAHRFNMYVRQIYRYLDLVKMLVEQEVTDLEVSTRWEKVR